MVIGRFPIYKLQNGKRKTVFYGTYVVSIWKTMPNVRW